MIIGRLHQTSEGEREAIQERPLETTPKPLKEATPEPLIEARG